MKKNPRIGDSGEIRFVVDTPHLIEFAEEKMPAVLSTPSLIWFLEHAAIQALSDLLDPGECSLGTQVDVQHLAPTPLGAAVVCTARVIHVEGPSVTFQVEAHDGRERVARGVHKRAVVSIERFATRVRQKQATGSR
jgi:predicted thioesterase